MARDSGAAGAAGAAAGAVSDMSPTLLLLLAGCAGAAFPDRAKIRTEGGSLVLQAAYDKDIELRPSGPRSRVLLRGRDLAALLAPAAPAPAPAPPPARLDALERALRDNVTALGANLTAVWVRLRRVARGLQAARAAAARRPSAPADSCASRPCLHGGTCLSLYAGFHCLCPGNWEGADCGDDVDECRRFAGTELGCQNDGLCVNRPGGYECQCRRGWLGVHCARATRQCAGAGGDAELCGRGACVPAGASVRCLCDRGWTHNATDAPCLDDVDECSNGEARCSSNPKVECINTAGGFRCGACPAGFEGDGFSCADVDECARDNGGCSLTPRVACLNTVGSRACGPCPPGYAGDGALCSWRGSCAEDNGGCHPAAECRAGVGGAGPQCVCPPGARGDGVGVAGCVLGVDAAGCEAGPCGAHGRCLRLAGGYTCLCERGYGGARCELAPDACAAGPCGGGGTCVADPRARLGFRCVCSAQFSGERCQLGRALCGGVLRAAEGSIEYPEGNGTYGHGARCAWVIQTRPDRVLNVTFSRFDVEPSPDCSYDFLQMHDGRSSAAQLLGRFCGAALPHGGNVVSSHNALYLWFLSDRSVARRGFALSWRSVAPACGGELAAGHGRLASPGSPGRYPPGRDCYWLVSAAPGHRVALHFYQMDLESHANCSFDFLAVYDGALATDPLLRRYCSSELPAPLTSAGAAALLHFHSDASGAGLGFQLAYSAEPGVPGCGGLYTAPRGDLASPSARGAYLGGLLCDYVIRAPPSSRVRLTFDSFALESSRDCEFDKLKVYDGDGEDAPLAGSYCGAARPPAFTSSGRALLLRFQTDRTVSSEGFRASYEAVCRRELRAPSGVIASPGFPMNYSHDAECEYVVEAPPGRAVSLHFQVFDLENNQYFDCAYDYVEVRDGGDRGAPLLGRWCGPRPPPPQLSTLNLLYVRFRSDASLSGAGFYANYTTVDTRCGGVHRRAPGALAAPSPPHPSAGLNCTWILAAPQGFYVHVTWDYFFVEDRAARGAGACGANYVQLAEDGAGAGALHIPPFCGRARPPELSSVYSTLKVLMVTDGDYYGTGFSLNFTFVDGATDCGGQYAHARGVLRSPGWPGPYPALRDCVWRVTAPAGHQLRLRARSFQLPPAYAGCQLVDHLEVRDGPSAGSPLVGSYCGTEIPQQIVSMSNSLYVHFHSDAYRSGAGFELEWDSAATGCGGTLTGASGSIASPGFPLPYPNNAECQYRVVTNPGTRIKLSFTHLQLEAARDCRSDYVQVHDGPDAGARSLGRFCAMTLQATELATSSNVAYVVFRSDLSVTAGGFSLQYFSICRNNLTGSFGVIESPGHPGPYPRDLDCKWNITVAPGNTVDLVFTHFVVRERVSFLSQLRDADAGCRSDYVRITDPAARTAHTYCGHDRPPPVSSRGRSLLVEFVSRTAPWATGFHLEWTKRGCGGTVQRSFGTIQLDGELAARSPLECEWLIETPEGSGVSLTVSQAHLEAAAGCATDALEVYGGGSAQAPLLTRLCHDGVAHALSSTNRMLVRLTKSSDLRDARFAAVFQKSALACGGLVVSRSGLIHSKNYPKDYDNDLDCTWTIHVPEQHRVALTFLQLDLNAAGADACGDYLQLSATGLWADAGAETRVCADSNVTRFVSSGNVLGVRFVTDAAGTAKGFKANFSVTCGAVITARFDGTITNDDSLSASGDNCTWTIVGAPEDKISLTLTHLSLPRESDGTTGEHCPSMFLRVYDGTDAGGPLLGEYCGRSVPPTVVSRGSALTVQYGSRRAPASGQFSATYSALAAACGGALSAERGRVASPGFPAPYPADAACEWTLDTAPGNRVRVVFESFALEASDNCDADYVELRERDGAGRLLGLYCGGRAPGDAITVADRMYIKFRSDGARSAPGFVLRYEMVHGLDVTGRERGEIASPLYPHLFDGAADYSWRIYLNDSATVVLHLDYLKIYDHGTECTNYLAVYDGYDEGANLLDLLCGIRSDVQLMSTSNVVYLKLKLDETNLGSKFHLKWWKSDVVEDEDGEEALNCGDNRTRAVGPGGARVVTSPGFPARYDNNLRCEWQLRAAPAHRLALLFSTVLLEEQIYCYADYISIYSADVDLVWKTVNKSVCTSDIENVVYRSPAYFKIKFVTDHSITFQGFKATVTSECGGVLNNSSGILELSWQDWYPKRYQGLVCEWKIRVRPGRTIAAVLKDFNITNPQDHCESYLILRNGESGESPLLASGKYCGAPHEVRDVATSSNVLYVKYRNPSASFLSFRLQYEERSAECGGAAALSELRPWAAVASPRYPSVPPPYSECEWALSAPRGRALQLDFIDRFDLEDDLDCSREYVEVHDGLTALAPTLGRYCRDKPGTVESSGNGILVKYAALSLEPRNGFKANVSLAACGGAVRAASGALAGPGYPRLPPLPAGTACQWRLVGEANRVLKLKIQDLDLPPSAEPCATRLTLEETLGPNGTVRVLDTFCSPDNRTAGAEVVTSTNEVRVRLQLGSPRASAGQRREHRGFRLTFASSRAAECGGRVAAAGGALLTPGYPRGSGARYCQWFLTAPAGRRVTLRVLDAPGEAAAPHTFRVYNDFNYQTAIAGANASEVIESTGNKMMVLLWGSGEATQFKFKATFTSAQPALCGGPLRGARGTLSAPELSRAYACEWHYRAADDAGGGATLRLAVSARSSGKRRQCRFSGPALLLRAADVTSGFSRDVCNTDEVFTVPTSQLDIKAFKTQSDPFPWTVTWQLNPCGGTRQVTSEPQDVLQLPANFTGALDCAWLLVTPYRERTELKIEGSFSRDCAEEYVAVMSGLSAFSTVVKKFCGSVEEPRSVSTSLSSLYVQYHGAGGAGRAVRLLASSAGVACGGVLGPLERSFSSPGFPRQYPASAECAWEVRAGRGARVALRFVRRFVLEQSANCSRDAVVVSDWSEGGGWRELARLCGRDLPPGFNSTDSRMKVVLRTDGAVNLDGFQAVWSPVYGGRFVATEREQFLYSPRYPLSYPPNADSEYRIDASGEPTSERRLVLKFLDFALEGSAPSCAYDNVTVTARSEYGLADESQTYCGRETPPARTYQRGASLRLRSDAYVQGRGFKLSYKLSRCGRELTAPTLLAFRPDSSRELRCEWRARAPPGSRVVFRFLRVDLPDYGACDGAHVSVYDGATRDAAVLARLCGRRGAAAVRSGGREALLEFEADSFEREDYGGFEAAVYFSPGPAAGCGGRERLSAARPSATVRAPRPPGAALYAPYLECVWTVEAPPGAAVRVRFSSFHVAPCRGVNQTAPGSGRCLCDSVELRDGPDGTGDTVGTFCGHSLPPPVTSSGALLSLLLSTDGEVGSAGFEAELSLAPTACGATQLQASDAPALLRSGGWPGAAPRGLRCVYRLDAGGGGVLLSVDDMRLLPAAPDTGRCERDQLVVTYDSDSELEEWGSGAPSEPRREAWCGRGAGQRLYAFGRVTVHLVTAAAGAAGAAGGDEPRVQLSYRRPPYCPGNATGEWGRLRTGPRRDESADCYMLLTAPENRTVTAYFRPLRASGAQDLRAWDGASERAPALLGPGADAARLVAVAASGRRLLLRARGLALDLHYVSTGAGRGCGGRLRAAAARVASPLYPAPYRRAGACSWRLETPPGSTLRLRFAVLDLGALCEQNYVVLRRRDGTEAARYCAEAPAPYSSADNFVELVQHSSMNNAGAGWVADFEAEWGPRAPAAPAYDFPRLDHVDSYQ